MVQGGRHACKTASATRVPLPSIANVPRKVHPKKKGQRFNGGSITTISEAHAYCADFAASMGFPFFMFALRLRLDDGDPRQAVLTNYPREFRRLYDERGYVQIDPVVTRLLHRIEPFGWDECPRNGERVAKLFDEAASFGLVDGFTIPLHCPGNEHAAFTLAGDRPLVAERARDLLFQRTWIFAVRTFGQMRELLLQALPAQKAARLTAREKEVIGLVAEGQGVREMSEILGLHRRSIEDVLRRAMDKLGVTSREQAIVRAIATGQIDLLSSFAGNLSMLRGAGDLLEDGHGS